MKKGEQADFTVKWWKGSQPKTLSTAGKLETELKAYEAALAKLKSDGDEPALKAVQSALDAVESAAKASAAEAGKAKGNAEMEATAQALGKMDFAGQRKAAEALLKDEEPEGLGDPAGYADALRKSLRKLMAGPMNFGLVLGAKAPDHRLLLHRTKGAKELATRAATELHLHLLSFGVASQSEDRPDTILLALEGKQLPGMAKKGGRMLKAFKPQPFSKIALFVDGQEVPDIVDPQDANEPDDEDAPGPGHTDDVAPLQHAMEQLGPRLRQAIANAPDRRGPLTQALMAFTEAVKAGDAATAQRLLTSLTTEVNRLVQAGPEIRGGTVQYAKLLLDWNSARQAAADSLKALEQVILKDFEKEEDFPEVQIRIRKLDVILARLGADLQDALDEAMDAQPGARQPLNAAARQIIGRYKAYVDGDPFVQAIESNPYQPVNVQSRLSSTLANLDQALAA